MAVSDGFLAYVLEQLEGLGVVRSRRMFGGVGLYCDDRFFAILDDNALYFKVDGATRGDYEARGMKPFCPDPRKPDRSMGYYQVPADVLEDAEILVAWARKAVRVADVTSVRSRRSKR